MSYFAEIDENGVVLRVIVIPDDQENKGIDFINNDLGLDGIWIETSETGEFRRNFASPGYTYNKDLDVFIPPQPKKWFVLNEETLTWYVPERINEMTGRPLKKEEIILRKIKSNIPNGIIYPKG